MKKLSFFFLLIILLNSCGFKEVGQVLRNEKIKTTDEFLVKKREPLVLPPDYSKLPEPSEKNVEENNEFDLQKILETSDSNTPSENSVNQSLKKSIIDKIKKN